MLLRISQLNWPRILFTRRAAILLGMAAALSVCGLIIIHSGISLDSLSPLKRGALSFTGAASAGGLISLTVCMGFFWLKCDRSSRPSRTIWFVLLLLGFAYGSQILYFAVSYVPAVLRRLRNPESEEDEVPQPRIEEVQKRIGPFRRVLLVGWGFSLLPIVAALALPKITSSFLGLIAALFFLGSAVVVVESIAHVVFLFYQAGMSRPPGSGGAGPSRPRSNHK